MSSPGSQGLISVKRLIFYVALQKNRLANLVRDEFFKKFASLWKPNGQKLIPASQAEEICYPKLQPSFSSAFK
jgi:hypothetical protein